MFRLVHTFQHAALLAVGLVLALAGGALAAAGGNWILGVANNSGTAQTALIANTTFPLHALVVDQNGTGNGGYFISEGGSGMLGIAKSGNKYAMSGTNDGAAGTGGAIIGMGKNNVALEATSDAKPPIKIVGPTNQAPMTVNSTVTVTNLSADRVDGLDVMELGVKEDVQESGTVEIFEDMTTYGSLTLYAPTAGRVTVVAAPTILNDGCVTGCVITAYLWGPTGASLPAQETIDGVLGNLTLTAVFDVQAGQNTFETTLDRDTGGDGHLYGWYNTMSADFSPAYPVVGGGSAASPVVPAAPKVAP